MPETRPAWTDFDGDSGLDLVAVVVEEAVDRLVLAQASPYVARIGQMLREAGVDNAIAGDVTDYINALVDHSAEFGARLGAALAVNPLGLGSFEAWLQRGLVAADLVHYEIPVQLSERVK